MHQRLLGGLSVASAAFTLLCSTAAAAYGPQASVEADTVKGQRQYTFSWMFENEGKMAPRGGTTTGTAVNLMIGASDAWLQLQEEGLSSKEKDRRAILAMAGPHRTSFDFIETVGFTEGYAPKEPYQSWGTEFVYVVDNEPGFVSLQHILVMEMVDEAGKAAEPIVVKHWRQDWVYEASEAHTFRGHLTWGREQLDDAGRAGSWVQSVYQVDDTPRYAARGRWEHYANYSSWRSEETWRPLPRREFSVRDDYHVLVGTNRHTITPTGWVQEEENLKVVLDELGRRVEVLAREAGLARYERIEGFDWSAGDAYWARTAPYWAVVRDAWRDIFASEQRFILQKQRGRKFLFMALFNQAEQTTQGEFDAAAARDMVDRTLAAYRSTVQP